MINGSLIEWLFLPAFAAPPAAFKLGADFAQLLFAAAQLRVFRVEMSEEAERYPGEFLLSCQD